MNRNVLAVSLFAIALWTGSVYAGQPVFTSGLSGGTLREMDLLLLNVAAADSAGHQLDYDWSITLDETNGQAFFVSRYHASAEFAVRWISSASAGMLNGRRVTIKAVARHANPLDGTESAETTATYTVQGVNHPPVPVISGKLGTPTDRIPTGLGVCADGYASSDPDGDTVRGNWGWGARSGGSWITPLGDLWPALFGSEGGRCCFTVIDMTAPIDQQIVLTLLNGLHSVKAVATCYLKPADVTTNQPPLARIQYTIGSAAYANAPVYSVDVDTSSPVTITLNANASIDDGGASNLTYTWTKQDSLTVGSTTLGNASGATTTVQILDHTTGAFSVTLTAKDQAGLTGTTTVSFSLMDLGEAVQKPIARVSVKAGGQAVTGPVMPGTAIVLDGSQSARPDDSKTGLTYQWTQKEGPNVAITDADKAIAQITTPASSAGPIWVKFQLIVKDGAIASDPVDVTIDLINSNSYFSQIGVGRLGTGELRSCLLLVNGTSVPATGIHVDFFGQDGLPLDVIINGSHWDGQPFDIPPFASERLVFSGQELKYGWARVKADTKVTGLLLYQVLDANNDIEEQVGLYSTEAARRFASFYDPKVETAIAVANPSAQPAQVQIRIIDNRTGAEVVSKLLFDDKTNGLLPAMAHEAKFLTQTFVGQLPLGFSVGTLLIESDVPIGVTILQTKGGVIFSTLPLQTPK